MRLRELSCEQLCSGQRAAAGVALALQVIQGIFDCPVKFQMVTEFEKTNNSLRWLIALQFLWMLCGIWGCEGEKPVRQLVTQ